MKTIKLILNIFILFFLGLIIAVLWSGGFRFELFHYEIKCYGISNPVLVLIFFLVIRLFLGMELKNSLTLLGSVLLTVILSEITLRVINPPMALPQLKSLTMPSRELGYALVPGWRDQQIQINSHGLRDHERDWKKPEGVKRLLGIGDSFTFGYRVALEDCYLKQLEKKLNTRGTKWDVINAGVVGYNMWQYLAYLKSYGYRYEPDLVTIGLYFDDPRGAPSAWDNASSRENNHERYNSLAKIRLINFARNISEIAHFRYRYFFNAYWLRSVEDRVRYLRANNQISFLMGEGNQALYEHFDSQLQEFVSFSKSRNAKVLVVLIPDVIQVNAPEYQKYNRIIALLCEKAGADFLDMTPVFEKAGYDIKKLYLLPYDAHTSPLGHALIAAEMEKKITALFP